MNETYQDICSFCSEIERRPEYNLFHELVDKEIAYTYLLKETSNFVVMPSIGSLMPGYLLVVPKLHVLSFGHLPSEYDEELHNILSSLVNWHSTAYGKKTIFFEHGSVSFTKRGGSCTDHAHLHVVPVPDSVDIVKGMYRDFPTKHIPGFEALRNQVKRELPYLFLRHHDGSLYVCDAPDAKSQHLRRDLVQQLDLEKGIWEWELYPGTDHILATIQKYGNYDKVSNESFI